MRMRMRRRCRRRRPRRRRFELWCGGRSHLVLLRAAACCLAKDGKKLKKIFFSVRREKQSTGEVFVKKAYIYSRTVGRSPCSFDSLLVSMLASNASPPPPPPPSVSMVCVGEVFFFFFSDGLDFLDGGCCFFFQRKVKGKLN